MTIAGSTDCVPIDQATSLRRLVRSVQAGCKVNQSVKRAHIVSVSSGKGGVGKTNLAVNLCIALSKLGLRVTLLDADLGLANADVICGLTVTGNLGHVINGKRNLEEISVSAPGGFMLIPGASGVVNASDPDSRDCDRLLTAMGQLENESDLIVIDTGAGNGRVVRTFMASADLCLVVTTPEPPAITDAYALIKTTIGQDSFQRQEIKRLSLVVNQAGSETEARNVYERISAVSRKFLGREIEFAGWLPHDEVVRKSVKQRLPFTIAAPKRNISLKIDQIAQWIVPSAENGEEERIKKSWGVTLRRLLTGSV